MAVAAIAQKTYLQLVQQSMQEAGVQQATPTSISDTTGLTPRFVDWVNQAFVEIQSEQEWDWRRSQLEFTLLTGNSTYNLQTNDNADLEGLIVHCTDSFKPYLLIRPLEVAEGVVSTEDQGRVYFIPYENWRGELKRLVDKDAGQPTYFTILPSKVLQFDREADDDYGLDVDILTQIVEMNADGDVPTLPKKYQDMIVWRTVVYYGGFDTDNPRVARALQRYSSYMKRMYEEQLPDPVFANSRIYESDY